MTSERADATNDWATGIKGFSLAWGLPIAALVGTIFVDPTLKTVIWIVALTWMGGACLLNARRCRRTHCFYTGPFFLVMTIPVALHGFAILPFGPEGWRWLSIMVGAGGGGIWYMTEKVWGRYQRKSGISAG